MYFGLDLGDSQSLVPIHGVVSLRDPSLEKIASVRALELCYHAYSKLPVEKINTAISENANFLIANTYFAYFMVLYKYGRLVLLV